MRLFTDVKCESWPIEIEVLLLDRVEKATGVDLLLLVGNDTPNISGAKFLEILHVACFRTCEDRGVSLEDFAKRLNRIDLMADAVYALHQAIADFSRPSGAAPILTLMEKSRAVMDRKLDLEEQRVTERVAALTDEEIEKEIDRVCGLAQNSSRNATGLEANSESTPDT